jgi:hypothetical protein
VVCLKRSVNGTRKQTKHEIQKKSTLLAFKIIAILYNTRLATFINLLETVSKGLFRNRKQNSCHTFLDCRRTALSVLDTPHICGISWLRVKGRYMFRALLAHPQEAIHKPTWDTACVLSQLAAPGL